MRALYTLGLRLALPFVLARLWWRGRREPGYREAIAERFGRYPEQDEQRIVWIHAVSVGEARAAAPLVKALAEALPGHAILVTSTTAAGRETVRQAYGASVISAYLPYDYPGAVQRFLERFRPRLGVLMETEIWPNLLAGCAANGVPVLLASARMSEKSARAYRFWSAFTRPAFGALAAVCAQSAADAARLRSLGARKVEVTGNLKFDVEPDPQQVAAGRAWREALGRPVLLLASTREGEEETLLNFLPRSSPHSSHEAQLLVVLVPRHPRRFDEVAHLAQSRRTRKPFPEATDRVYLGDTMGEMSFYYAAADVAVIGGSFQALGGQNLIEALAVGTAVIVGPSMFNFAEAAQLAVGAGAAVQTTDAAAAMAEAQLLFKDPEKRTRMGEAARRFCELHRGAAERHLRICLRLLK
jgi:3-deoxy-D-manno-octulosonic-acid transferase